jgi:hypothetical protein
MVIVAPPHTDSAPTRGAAGWYVLLLMTIAAVVAIWFAYETWRPGDGLAAKLNTQQDAIRQDEALRDYMNRLIAQTQDFQQPRPSRTYPDAPLPPELVRGVDAGIKALAAQSKSNISICLRDVATCKTRTKTVQCRLSTSWCDQMKVADSEYDDAQRNKALDAMAVAERKRASLFCEASLAFQCPEDATLAKGP